jgi:beta-ribofuranosylaminobenzene 5'-phosphate synthase
MSVVVSTPSRLHFGLLRFAQAEGPSFGGLGMMIAEPRCVVEIEASEAWAGEGVGFQRALEFARRVLDAVEAPVKPPSLRLRITSVIAAHQGLGGGTQLALAVAAGIRALLGLPTATAAELAALTGRGQRSAVGTHGFIHGGLIWEAGRQPGEAIGRLVARVPVPESWRIVLVNFHNQAGLSGKPEIDAFEGLSPVPAPTTERLKQLAERDILPAAERGSLEYFGEAVYEYGRIAGECFAPVQGGPYASLTVADCVHTIRDLGIAGVGQSSWGPTVFAVTEDLQQAEWLVETLAGRSAGSHHELHITAPDNRGATIAHYAADH